MESALTEPKAEGSGLQPTLEVQSRWTWENHVQISESIKLALALGQSSRLLSKIMVVHRGSHQALSSSSLYKWEALPITDVTGSELYCWAVIVEELWSQTERCCEGQAIQYLQQLAQGNVSRRD